MRKKKFAEGAKPEWWNDEGLKALSARVVRAAPNEEGANRMRADVLRGGVVWEAGPRLGVELIEAAAHFDRAAALSSAPAMKANYASCAVACRSLRALEAEDGWLPNV